MLSTKSSRAALDSMLGTEVKSDYNLQMSCSYNTSKHIMKKQRI